MLANVCEEKIMVAVVTWRACMELRLIWVLC